MVESRAQGRAGRVVPVVLALTLAFAFGALDQDLQVVAPAAHPAASQFLVQVSNGMSAPWLLVPFLAGAWQAGGRRAALVGLAATWLSVLGYVLMIVSPMEGAHWAPRTFALSLASQWPWFIGGLVTGPLYGWLGHSWRTRRSLTAAMLAALPVLLEPAARWLTTVLSAGSPAWRPFWWPTGTGGVAAELAELGAGALLTGALVRGTQRDRSAART